MNDFYPLMALAISLLIGAGGIVFMFKEKVIYDSSRHETKIEIPFFGRLHTNYPAIAAFFISAALAGYITNVWKSEMKRIPITASVQIADRDWEERPQIIVGVIPGSALRLESFHNDDVPYELDIPVVDGELSYTGVAQIRLPGHTDMDIGTAVPGADGKLRFDAILEGKPALDTSTTVLR